MIYSKHQAAQKFGVSTKTIERKIAAGLMPYHKIGSRVVFDDDDLESFWDKCRVAAREQGCENSK